MAVFLLRIKKRVEGLAKVRSRPPGAALMTKAYSWLGQRVEFSVFTVANVAKPRVEENGNHLLFIHGRSPNANLTNCRDLNSLNGNFNLVLINKQDETVELVKDFCNSLDVFEYEDELEVIFTNNPLLIESKGFALDEAAIAQYLLCYTGLWSQNYFLKQVRKVRRGSVSRVESMRDPVTIQRQTMDARIQERSLEEFLTNFDAIVKANVRDLPPTEVTADLTGGYDSRLVVSCLLHNKLHFRALVYGEADEEVRFVTELARNLNVPLVVVAIDEHIVTGCRDWKRLFWLSGGSYNFFEVLKEGTRATIRAGFGNYRIAGGLGEVLRDAYYVDGLLRSRLERIGLPAAIERKLISMPREPYLWCHEGFRPRLDTFLSALRESLRSEATQGARVDPTQCFMNAVFERYVTGWLGTLYGFHGNMVTMIAPFIDCSFPAGCLYVNSEFRRHGAGVAHATVKFWPPLAEIPYIDGHRSRPPRGFGLIDFYLSHHWMQFRRKILAHKQKVTYEYAEWLRLLKLDTEFCDLLEAKSDHFSSIISDDAFKRLLMRGETGQLDRAGFDFLGKLLSLKFTLLN